MGRVVGGFGDPAGHDPEALELLCLPNPRLERQAPLLVLPALGRVDERQLQRGLRVELEAWNEEAVATLAVACGDSELLDAAVRLWDEAIALHTRTAPNRGVGDGTLARYWREKADVLARLGRQKILYRSAAVFLGHR